jgi:porin
VTRLCRSSRTSWGEALSVIFGAFNGDPASSGQGNPQQLDRTGTTFRVNGDQFYIGELAQNFELGTDEHALPGTFKLGGWYHSGVFSDQRYDAAGLSLANPMSTGIPASHTRCTGDFSPWRARRRCVRNAVHRRHGERGRVRLENCNQLLVG